jgi:beta-glucanase (GH16 family)
MNKMFVGFTKILLTINVLYSAHAQRIEKDWLLNFNSPNDLNAFVQETGEYGLTNASEKFVYTQNNVDIRNGALCIITEREADKYTSAKLVTKASFRYGTIEIKAKLPKGTGVHSSFVLVPVKKPENTVNNAEIVVMKHDGYEPVR